MNKNLYVIGDSHTVIWEGGDVLCRTQVPKFDNVVVRHLPQPLAWNLMNQDGLSIGKWGIEVFKNLTKDHVDKSNTSAVMLSFGEIDIRTQVFKRALISSSTLEESVSLIVDRLINFSEYLYDKINLPILIWEPIATQSGGVTDPSFPATGTEYERNYSTKVFQQLCRSRTTLLRKNNKDIYSFGIYDQMSEYFLTNKKFLNDGCHLNLTGFHIAVDQFRNLSDTYQLRFQDYFKNMLVSEKPKIREISNDVFLRPSSVYAEPMLLARQTTGWCFHTDLEKKPYVLIDIGYSAKIEKLVLHNRFDCEKGRATTLAIAVGDDPLQLDVIYQNNTPWGFNDVPISVFFDDIQTSKGFRLLVQVCDDLSISSFMSRYPLYRYIKLSINSYEYFHLGEVQIYEKTFKISF